MDFQFRAFARTRVCESAQIREKSESKFRAPVVNFSPSIVCEWSLI